MPDIFLSYSREDDATATRFAEAFRREGFSVWWDQALRSGETYDEVTERALREAKAVVVLWSRRSVQSRWVRSEAKIADRSGTLVPVMIETCDRPVMFELAQTTDLTHWKGSAHDKGWTALVDDVRRLVAGDAASQAPPASRSRPGFFRSWKAIAVGALLLVLGAGAWWLQLLKPDQPPSIAVLPFADLTREGNDAALAEGLSEEITNRLAQIPDLRVVSRTSAFKFKGANQDVRSVGKQLGATHIVEGSIRRGDDRLRITVQMVGSKDGLHHWSKTIDLPDGDVLRIEDIVSRAVAETLKARLSPDTERRWKERDAREPEAFALYLQGRHELRLRTPEGNLLAQELFRRAIAKDPQFALAYASLVEATLNSVTLNGRDQEQAESEAEPLLAKALALSPDMPEVIAASGRLATEQYRTEEAVALLQRALALNPSDTDTHRRMGVLHQQLAQPRQAVAQYDVAAQLDPLEFMNHVYRCLGLQDLAQFAMAETACARARELNASSVWGPMATSWLFLGKGDLAAALKWINRAAEVAPQDMSVLEQRVQLLLALRRYDAAREAVAGLPASAEPARSFMNALIAEAQGDLASLRTLTNAIASRSGLSADEWMSLAHLQLITGNAVSAKLSLDRARRSDGFRPAELVDPGYVRSGFSAAVIVAEVELAAGNRAAAFEALKPLDDVLDRMEKDGAACGGLFFLRAVSLALRGEPERSMVALKRANEQGWHLSGSARNEPFLQSLHHRDDFKALLAKGDQHVRSISVDAHALPP